MENILACIVLFCILLLILENRRKYAIMREVCRLIAKDLLCRMAAAKVTANQFDRLEVYSSGLNIYPYALKKTLGIPVNTAHPYAYAFKRKNGKTVDLSDNPKLLEKMAKYFLSALDMTADYTFVRACDVFGSGDTVVSEIRDTGRGVEVTTRPKYYSSEKVIICRRSDVSKYPPEKTKTYRL